MLSSAEVREQLVRALRIDLVGPNPTDEASCQTEELPQAPSKWYLTGFLVPYEANVHDRSDPTANDELDFAGQTGASDEENTPEMASARKGLFPSSIGLSCLVSKDTQALEVEVYWGDYAPIKQASSAETALQERTSTPWQRFRELRRLTVSLPNTSAPVSIAIPDSRGLELSVSIRPVTGTDKLPAGTRAVSIFLVNHRRPEPDTQRDAAYIFQAQLTLHNADGFVPRPDLRNQRIEDEDERLADLQYRNDYEYAVGHNVSALSFPDEAQRCTEVCTAWMPTAEVEKVIANEAIPVELSMEAIATAQDAEAVRTLISPMVQAYTDWIAAQPIPSLTCATDPRPDTARELLRRAMIVNRRRTASARRSASSRSFSDCQSCDRNSDSSAVDAQQ